MKLLIHSDLADSHYFAHGFGSIMNKALRSAYLHFEQFGNWSITFDDPYLSQLFDFKPLEPDYVRNLILETGPKDIKKNQFAFWNVFYPKAEVLSQCINVRNLVFTEKTIGIHARGTDKKIEYPRVKIDTIRSFADPYVKRGYSIFLATDDQIFLDKLTGIYGSDLVRHDSTAAISSNGSPVHLGLSDPTEVYFDAFRAAYLLANSDVFLYCHSNLSELALAMQKPGKTSINLQPQDKGNNFQKTKRLL